MLAIDDVLDVIAELEQLAGVEDHLEEGSLSGRDYLRLSVALFQFILAICIQLHHDRGPQIVPHSKGLALRRLYEDLPELQSDRVSEDLLQLLPTQLYSIVNI